MQFVSLFHSRILTTVSIHVTQSECHIVHRNYVTNYEQINEFISGTRVHSKHSNSKTDTYAHTRKYRIKH